MPKPSLTDQLNSNQLKAVEKIHGPLLILAGAGSGKTKTITHRMAHIITQGEASPSEILAMTFTNKAAKEMKHRITELLQSFDIPIHQDLWVSTFHSFCVKILKSHINLLGYPSFFVIYDDSDQLQAIKKVLKNLNIDDKTNPPKVFKSLINQAKTLGLNWNQVKKNAPNLMTKKEIQVYEEYSELLVRSNALDFNDLLLKAYEIFFSHPEILEQYQNQFKFIMVDEYQDTNHIQYLLIQMLSKKHRNLCVVGDEDQSIYSWRGADIQNILGFEKDFPEALTIKLEKNYRSTKTIVEAASAMIQNNSQRKPKVLFTENEQGSKIQIQEEPRDYNEAQFVAKNIQSMINKEDDFTFKDFAIFYRTNAQSRVLEDQLRSRRIPYKIVGGTQFYQRMEIKDILAYMRTLLNFNDDIAVKRIINNPTRGIGKTSIDKIDLLATQMGFSFFEACKLAVQENALPARTVNKVNSFCNLMINLSEQAESGNSTEIYYAILEQTQYFEILKKENSTEATARMENLEELANAIMQFEKERGEEASLQDFLEEVVLISEADKVDDSEDQVTLMTLHISKGLEFSNVHIVGLEEGLFPSGQSNNDPDKLEEERRLAYVGITRAKKNLFLSYAKRRQIWGQDQYHEPSRFLQEIPEELVSTSRSSSAETGLFHSQQGSTFSKAAARAKVNEFELEFDNSSTPDYEDFPSDEAPRITKGTRVRHPTFGVGSIYKIEGKGDQQKVSILFKDNYLKKFMTKYARLEIIN